MKSNNQIEKISVIVPVFYEEDRIIGFLHHIKKIAAGEPAEIIVIDGDVHGSTIRKISPEAARTLRSAKGRGTQMNAGAAAAQGDILLFVHADNFLPEKAFGLIRETLKDEECCGGAFDLGIDSSRFLL